MPKATVHNAIARQWELLKILPPRNPGLTAAALTQRLRNAGFSVTKRTIERDLLELSGPFGVRCNDTSKPYGWHWMEGGVPGFPRMDFTDALSLTLVEELLARIDHTFLANETTLGAKSHASSAALGQIRANDKTAWRFCFSVHFPPAVDHPWPEVSVECLRNAR